MAPARAKEIGQFSAFCTKPGRNLLSFPPMTAGQYQVHSEARGPHWVAWITRGQDKKPERSVVIVAETQELAESKARQWADRQG
jgi:hypothetical protein